MLEIDATGDLVRATGRFQQLSEADAQAGNRQTMGQLIGQRVQIRLSRWAGEWSYDTRLGVPWDVLLQKGVSETQLQARITAEILKAPGVASIPELTLVRSGRSVSVSCRAVAVGATEPVEFSVNIPV